MLFDFQRSELECEVKRTDSLGLLVPECISFCPFAIKKDLWWELEWSLAV